MDMRFLDIFPETDDSRLNLVELLSQVSEASKISGNREIHKAEKPFYLKYEATITQKNRRTNFELTIMLNRADSLIVNVRTDVTECTENIKLKEIS